ncbi:MAG: DUF5615 family PIN-like protein [Armatimonadetes bacterium]|nr:DUF5615 family PIN-like protein [Armatimonadota bacterium]
MLRYLLDEHLSPAVASGITTRRPDIPVVALRDWQAGAFLGAADETILAAAHADRRSLVTFDLRTVPALLRVWIESGSVHGGVVFVHARTLAPENVGGLVHALIGLWDAEHALDWTDRVVYLSR